MKKDLSIALSGIMAVLMLTGCGHKTETEVAPTKVKVMNGQTSAVPIDTVDMLDEFQRLYGDYFPEAYVRFKQMSYSEAVAPLEVRLTGSNLEHLRLAADSLQTVLRSWPELRMVRTNLNEPRPTSHIALHEDRSTRMGLTNFGIESTLAMRYGSGLPVASVYEGDDEVPVVIKSNRADSATTGHLTDEQIPVVGGLGHLPLRQVADIEPQWEMGSIPHRNGVRCVTVSAEFDRSQRVNGIAEKEKVERMIRERGAQFLPSDVSISYGGDFEESDDNLLFILTIIPVAYYGLTPNPSPNGEGSR